MRTIVLLLLSLLFISLQSGATSYIVSACFLKDSLPQDSVPLNPIIHQMKMMSDEMSAIKQSVQKIEAESNKDSDRKKNVHIGLSLGYRWLTSASSMQYTLASISPIDSTLRITRLERTTYLFSTSVIFDLNLGRLRQPENQQIILERRSQRRSGKKFRSNTSAKSTVQSRRSVMGNFLYNSLDRLCLVSNLNILDFSSGQKELAFNKSIEGGLGIGYKLNENMYIGVNWEHIQSWQLYDDLKQSEGKQLVIDGEVVTNSNLLDPDNDDLFYKKSLSGWGLKIIVSL